MHPETAPDPANVPAAAAESGWTAAGTLDPGQRSARRLLIGGGLLAIAILYASWEHGEVKRPPGVLVPEEPYQTAVDNTASWESNGFRIEPLARIRLRARVLHTERYWFDAGSKISPMDLALGWGPMSDQRVVDRLSIWQGQRWYHWQPKDKVLPITGADVMRSSANMHMIPADGAIGKRLKSVRAGDIVELSGELVAVHGKGGWEWRSSLTRTDTGNGACELVWVRELSIR